MISLVTNVTSLNAQRNLNINNAFQSKTIGELTSGYRINSSGDDAAGLAIANSYRNNVAQLTQGVANANNATSQLQIIDGGLSNISTILDRLQTLASEAASGNPSSTTLATLDQEYQGLLSEVDRQANNIGLGAGNAANIVTLSVYIGGGITATDSTVNVDLHTASVGTTGLGITGGSLLTATGIAAALTAVSAAVTALGTAQGAVGAGENTLNYATNLANSQISSYSAAESQIRDADVAAQAANLTKAQVLVQTSVAALAQANSSPQAILKLLQG
jgi:flagellin